MGPHPLCAQDWLVSAAALESSPTRVRCSQASFECSGAENYHATKRCRVRTETSGAGKPMVPVILAGRPFTFHDVAAKAGALLAPPRRIRPIVRRGRVRACIAKPADHEHARGGLTDRGNSDQGERVSQAHQSDCGALNAEGALGSDSQRRLPPILGGQGDRKHRSPCRCSRLTALLRTMTMRPRGAARRLTRASVHD